MTRFAIAITALLLNPLLLRAQPDESSLAYRLKPGDSYLLEIDLQQTTESESVDSEEISFYTLTGIVFHIDSIDGDKLIHMRVRYRDLLISMLAPSLQIDISSASENNPLLSEMVKKLEQGSFQVAMSPRGELHSLEGLERMFTAIPEEAHADSLEMQVILRTLDEAYGPDAFKSIFGIFVTIYPVITPMNNWTNDISYFFNTKAVKMVNRYYLTKTTEDMQVIQGMGMLNATREFFETTNMGKVKSAVSGSQTYDFQVDRLTGWPMRCVSRQRVMIETTILESKYLPAGLKIPSYTETVFEVKGKKL